MSREKYILLVRYNHNRNYNVIEVANHETMRFKIIMMLYFEHKCDSFQLINNELRSKFKVVYDDGDSVKSYIEGDVSEMIDIVTKYFRISNVIEDLGYTLSEISKMFSRMKIIRNELKYVYLDELEKKCNIDKIKNNNANILDEINICFDEYLDSIEDTFGINNNKMEVIYLYNLREILSKITILIMNYQISKKKLLKLDPTKKCIDIKYKYPTSFDILEYRKIIKKCPGSYPDSNENYEDSWKLK